MKHKSKILIVTLVVAFISCKKDTKTIEPEPTPAFGKLNIEFENVVGTASLQFDTNYVNQNGDTFKVSKFNYYISNIVITNNDNSTFIEPNSYHLVEHSNPASSQIMLSNVPAGSYKTISFMLGVDSTHNVSGAQTGDLEPGKGMFWTWSTGYIMFKLEGTSPKAPAINSYNIEYHVGGFKGAYNSLCNFTFNFASTTANVSASISPKIHLQTDVLEMFKNPSTVNITTDYSIVNVNSRSKMIANNYTDMIHFEHVHN